MDIAGREKARADRAEADVRSWEAKWLQEKMNAKAATEKHDAECLRLENLLATAEKQARIDTQRDADIIAAKDAELALLRQRAEELRRDATTCCRSKRGMCDHGNV